MSSPVTSHSSPPSGGQQRRERLTLDISPELHMRLKITAAQQKIAMREVVERLLERELPTQQQLDAGARLDVSQLPAISHQSSERLRALRLAIMQGRVFSESSADLLHEDRDERESRDGITDA